MTAAAIRLAALKSQAQASRGHQVGEQAGGMGQQGQHAKADEQTFVRFGALGQTSALIEGRSGIQNGGGEAG